MLYKLSNFKPLLLDLRQTCIIIVWPKPINLLGNNRIHKCVQLTELETVCHCLQRQQAMHDSVAVLECDKFLINAQWQICKENGCLVATCILE